ncbi:MAG: hypothetical protein M0R33_20155 [Methylomonas sp.]|jgi:hypothetical protein|nr:hypothetical protein [Methylomonas sp.]MCK9608759.1 hypothetical protein [Methylomonas sp.]
MKQVFKIAAFDGLWDILTKLSSSKAARLLKFTVSIHFIDAYQTRFTLH